MIEPGTLLQNRYRVTKQIGQGGMGAVYVATDERFQSTVAVKQTLFDDPTLRKAFEREAQLLNHLRHAALPKVSDHFIEGDGQFLVMEFIEGADLSDLLNERDGAAFPVADVLQWADELLNALDYLHTQTPAIIHRDIKPQNLKLTTRGQIVLLDFGLAKGTPAQMHASTTASIFGYSRNYAPLEQIQGTGTDARSDLYSLGATLYHLLTGTAPVDALTRASAIINNQPDPLAPAHLVCDQVPTAVGGVLHRAMAQNAARRPQTAAAMRAALRQAAQAVHDITPHTPVAHSAAFNEATMLTESADAPDEQPATNATNRVGRATTQTRRPASPSPSELSVTVTAAQHMPPRPARTYVAPAQSEPPARKSAKLVVAAVIALLVACASVPLLLKHRAAAPAAASSDAPMTGPINTSTDAQTGAPLAPAPTDNAPSDSLSTTTAPTPTNDPAATSAAAAQTNAAPAANAAAPANVAGATTNAASEATGQTAPAGITTAGRPASKYAIQFPPRRPTTAATHARPPRVAPRKQRKPKRLAAPKKRAGPKKIAVLPTTRAGPKTRAASTKFCANWATRSRLKVAGRRHHSAVGRHPRRPTDADHRSLKS